MAVTANEFYPIARQPNLRAERIVREREVAFLRPIWLRRPSPELQVYGRASVTAGIKVESAAGEDKGRVAMVRNFKPARARLDGAADRVVEAGLALAE